MGGKYDFEFYAGVAQRFYVQTNLDLTGAEFAAKVKRSPFDQKVLATLVVAVVDDAEDGLISVTVDGDATSKIAFDPNQDAGGIRAQWDLIVTLADDSEIPLLEGQCLVKKAVSA